MMRLLKILRSNVVQHDPNGCLDAVQTTAVFDACFDLANDLSLRFDPSQGGKMQAGVIRPEGSDPFIRLRPVSLGADAWYMLECPVETQHIRARQHLMVHLDVAAPRSALVFGILRFQHPNGTFTDVSSSQVELRQGRNQHALTILLDEGTPAAVFDDPARLMLCVEARDVDLDLYEFGAFCLPTRLISTLSKAKSYTKSLVKKVPGSVRVYRKLLSLKHRISGS